jgi:hypothetical protein
MTSDKYGRQTIASSDMMRGSYESGTTYDKFASTMQPRNTAQPMVSSGLSAIPEKKYNYQNNYMSNPKIE